MSRHFVVWSHQRSGSHLLLNLLNAHPGIICSSDLDTTKAVKNGQEWAYQNSFAPTEFPSTHSGCLVKFDYMSIFDSGPALRGPGILLTRKNRLAMFLSHAVARTLGCYEKPEDGITLNDARRLRSRRAPDFLDPMAAWMYFEIASAKEREIRRKLAQADLLEIYYEDLLANPNVTMARVFQYLDLPPYEARCSTGERGAHKLDPRELTESISNYQQLQDFFQASPWEAYFEPSADPRTAEDRSTLWLSGPICSGLSSLKRVTARAEVGLWSSVQSSDWVSIREPVSRSYAHYWLNFQLGCEYRTFESVIDRELAGGYEQSGYLRNSLYGDRVSDSNILLYEELMDQPDRVLAELACSLRHQSCGKIPNKEWQPRNHQFLEFCARYGTSGRYPYQPFLRWLHARLNIRKKYPILRDEIRFRLRDFFKNDRESLSRRIDLQSWDNVSFRGSRLVLERALDH